MKGILCRMTKTVGYGPHLMLDLSNCNPDKLNDLEYCYRLLDSLPESIGMTKITRPYVFRYEGKVPEDAGITGVVIIAESHISIHTYPLKNYAFVDVFSCKPFDVEKTKTYIIEALESKTPQVALTDRGADFPN
ncbi:MAG: adenosylmethionine decarboxylase [Candidatus Neomarinimicrobiota bacterium]